MQYSKYEQETIINYNNEEQTAEVYTYDRKLKKRLTELSEKYPSECYPIKGYRDDALTCTIPKLWIKINPPRVISEEQKKKLAENLKTARLHRENKQEA